MKNYVEFSASQLNIGLECAWSESRGRYDPHYVVSLLSFISRSKFIQDFFNIWLKQELEASSKEDEYRELNKEESLALWDLMEKDIPESVCRNIKKKLLKTESIALDLHKIVILKTDGTDKVLLYTNLPSPFPNTYSDSPLMISFESAKSWAEKYVKENFPGIPVECLDVSSGET